MRKSSFGFIVLVIGLTLLFGFTAHKEDGTFVYQRDGRKIAQESFTVEKLSEDKMVVSSTFQLVGEEDITAYIPSGSYTQVFRLDENFGLLSYLYQMNTKEGKLQVKVDMENSKAAVTTVLTTESGEENIITREADPGDRFIFTQVSGVQLMILQRIIHQNWSPKFSDQGFKLFGLYPTDPLKPSLKEIEVWKSKPTLLSGGSEIITAQRYRLKINDIYQDKDLTLRTYSDKGRLLGLEFYGDSRILVYRADLFPNGFF